MSYFLSGQTLHSGLEFDFSGEEASHLLSSRRTRAGEQFVVQDPQGQRFLAEVIRVERRQARVRVLEPVAPPPMPPSSVWLFQAAVKEKALEFIIQKGTELGMAELVVFPSAHSTLPHRALQNPMNAQRWERIAWEACKQSDRVSPPGIRTVPDLSAALALAATLSPGAGFLLQAGANQTLARALSELQPTGLQRGAMVRLLVGPEGGWTPEEVQQAQHARWDPVRLGHAVLRAETAALAACTLAVYSHPED
ncbi:MAG: 16S rRNA (uracil(1498)-N(3))-methyltransferase [Deltaproteobacteria bacterium]|nr:16S rRNA (uracil(1498)-N(3))-methyltransferase [Deltaproteobacteria bacterium]